MRLSNVDFEERTDPSADFLSLLDKVIDCAQPTVIKLSTKNVLNANDNTIVPVWDDSIDMEVNN